MKYFDYGLPANYALVDSFSRTIWLVTPNEAWAHELKHTLYGKTNFTVYDLKSFSNYNEQLIDNSVCVNWSVAEVAKPLANRVSLHTAQAWDTADASELTHDQLMEKNTVRLPPDLAQDFQQQIMLTYLLIKHWHQGPGTESVTEHTHFEQLKTICGREISLAQQEQCLAEFAQQNLLNCGGITVKTLQLLDRLYD